MSFIKINFNKKFFKNYAIIVKILKIKKKSNFIALIKYTNGSFTHINLLHGCFLGSILKTFLFFLDNLFTLKPGYTLFVSFLPRFSILSNICIRYSIYPKYIRSAGTFCQLTYVDHDYDLYKIKLFKDKFIYVNKYILVSLGRNSNILNKKIIIGKAGLSKKLGYRPLVRGVAMNAVDHPNGGRTKSNSPEKSIWGWIAKKNK
jgi:large subunit ribosomal protein L2